MFRKLSEEEKRNIMANYILGAYLIRFLMGAWMLFVTIGYVNGIKKAVEEIAQGNYFSGIGSMIAGVVAAIFFYGVPIVLIRIVGTEEIKLLKNDEIYIGEAFFVSSSYSLRSRERGRSTRYFAKIKLIDEWGNAYSQKECRSIGNLGTTCREGDRITVLRLVKPTGEELVCMKKKLI